MRKKKLTLEDGYVTDIHPPGSANNIQREVILPELNRPKIHYWKAFLFVLAHLVAGYCIMLLIAIFIKDDFKAMNLFAVSWFFIPVLILFALTSRFVCIWCVLLYQRYARAEVRLRCCMTPSCSAYSILAFKKYGTVIGLIKTFRRLKRCIPPGAIDYP